MTHHPTPAPASNEDPARPDRTRSIRAWARTALPWILALVAAVAISEFRLAQLRDYVDDVENAVGYRESEIQDLQIQVEQLERELDRQKTELMLMEARIPTRR